MAKKKDEEKKSLSDQFTEALPMFLPMLAGGLIGGLDTAVAAQEGANKAVEAQAAADVAAAKQALEEKRLEEQSRLQEKELELQERGLQQDMQIAQLSMAAQGAKKKKLSAEQQKRLDSVQMGQVAIEDIQAAMDKGVNKFSLVGDNEFTFARDRFVEAIGRMQTGAVISEEESKRFASMLPGVMDSEEIARTKMATLRDELARRYEGLTGEQSELANVSKQTQGLKDLAAALSIEDIQAEMARRKGQ